MKFPWRLWSRRVEGNLRVVMATERRLVAAEYAEEERTGRLVPIALIGIETETGQERWRRKLDIKLLDPNEPWSVQMARKDRVLAVWLDGNKLLGIDIYTGRNFWAKARPNSMGVAAVGFGFVTAWKDKVHFLKPASGEATNSFDIPAPVTGPVQVSAEGEAVLLCGKKLVAVNLNNGQVAWQHTLALKDGLLPATPRLLEEAILVGHDTVEEIVNTAVMKLESKSLKPRWTLTLPGRVRTHDSLNVTNEEIQLLFMHRGGKQRWHRVDADKGREVATMPARSRKGCMEGDQYDYCPYRKKGSQGIEAIDEKTMKTQWTWETLSDPFKNEHFYAKKKKTLYVADGKKVVGVDMTGKTVFKARVLQPGINLQVNRVLGIAGDTLVITAVDWGQMGQNSVGEIWGINLKNSRRRWRKKLPGPIYTTDAVKMVGNRIYYLDHRRTHMLRATSGYALDNWIHKLPGKPVSPPHLHRTGDVLYVTRGEKLAVLNPKNARPRWRVDVPPGSRIVGVETGLLVVRSPDRRLHAHDLAKGKVLWKKAWPEPADPKLVDLTESAMKGLLLAGRQKSLVVDPKTGEQKGKWSGVVHIQRLSDGDLLAVQVLKRSPKNENVLKALGIRRRKDSTELVELWSLELPRQKPKEGEEPSEPKGGWSWWSVAGTTVLVKEKESGCLRAVGLDDGKQIWKSCDIQWTAPPKPYKGKLYHATGKLVPAKTEEKQGLLSIDPYSGETSHILKIPGPSSAENRYMLPSYCPIRQGVIYLLTHGPRLRAVKVAK
jgi:outer membrane protein assembly factor BamB